MHILVTEASEGESKNVVESLAAAGHRVSTCHEAGSICRAMVPGGKCPLDLIYDPIEVTVGVRSGGRPELSTREYGLVCSVRADVPFVVTSAHERPSPAAPSGFADAVYAAVPESHLVDACGRAVWATDEGRWAPFRRPRVSS